MTTATSRGPGKRTARSLGESSPRISLAIETGDASLIMLPVGRDKRLPSSEPSAAEPLQAKIRALGAWIVSATTSGLNIIFHSYHEIPIPL